MGTHLSTMDEISDLWTMSFPMEWPFGDCQWGQAASKGFDATMSIAEYCKYLLQREELEYSTEEEMSLGEIYVAPEVCRFRHPQILFLIASVWRFAEALTAVNAWVRKPKMYKLLKVLLNLSPEVFRDAMLDVAQNGDGQGSSEKKNKPAALKTALRALLLATSEVLGSDGHRRLLRHEGVSYSLCFGPPFTFLTPNLADKLMPMLLLANGQCTYAFLKIDQMVVAAPCSSRYIYIYKYIVDKATLR